MYSARLFILGCASTWLGKIDRPFQSFWSVDSQSFKRIKTVPCHLASYIHWFWPFRGCFDHMVDFQKIPIRLPVTGDMWRLLNNVHHIILNEAHHATETQKLLSFFWFLAIVFELYVYKADNLNTGKWISVQQRQVVQHTGGPPTTSCLLWIATLAPGVTEPRRLLL